MQKSRDCVVRIVLLVIVLFKKEKADDFRNLEQVVRIIEVLDKV